MYYWKAVPTLSGQVVHMQQKSEYAEWAVEDAEEEKKQHELERKPVLDSQPKEAVVEVEKAIDVEAAKQVTESENAVLLEGNTSSVVLSREDVE